MPIPRPHSNPTMSITFCSSLRSVASSLLVFFVPFLLNNDNKQKRARVGGILVIHTIPLLSTPLLLRNFNTQVRLLLLQQLLHPESLLLTSLALSFHSPNPLVK